MNDRFKPLGDTATWFRLAEQGSVHLPKDAVQPRAEWLRPTDADVQEGQRRGRSPGVSVWDRGLTTVSQACLLAAKSGGLAFGMTVARCLAIGREQQPERRLDIVSDPLDEQKSTPGWEGHALLEGLHWEGESKRAKRDRKALREAIIAELVVVEE